MKPSAVAGIVLVVAIALRWVLDPVLGSAFPLVTLFGAVAAAVWLAGPRVAAVVALLGYAACEYLFIPPRGWPFPKDWAGVVGLLAFAGTSACIVAIGAAMRRARNHAAEQGQLFRVTLGSIGDAVITTDTAGNVTYLNSVAETLTGWTSALASGQPLETVFRIVNEETRKPVESPATRALREGVVVGLANHTILLPRHGGECPIDDSAAPIRHEGGGIAGCVLVFRDVSAQRRAAREKAVQLDSARLLAAIVESSDDAIISKSLDGIIQSWNAGAERLFGHTAAQAVGRHISLIIPAERLADEDKIIASLKAGRRLDHFETERVRRDGRRLLVSLTISPIRDETGAVVGASKIARDITRQREAEAERQRFVTLVESSTDFIGISDLDGVPLFVNRAGLALVGLESMEAARQVEVGAFFFPEDRSRVVDEFFPSVLATGRGELEIRFRNFKTGEARWMAYKVLALPGLDGRPTAFATVSQDVTERKRLEDDLRRAAADLSEADQRKNEFLATLAHELRNPLAVVSNAAGTLRRADGAAHSRQPTLDLLERQIQQMSRLVDDLMDVSRVTRGKIELRLGRVELRRLVEQAVEATRALYGERHQQLSVALPPQPVMVTADHARLVQVISNLLSNACKFTDPGGRIELTVTREREQVVVRVRDNGIGIKADHLPRLFEMFSQAEPSLDRSRDGLGIGLTLVRRLVELHGGTVVARSEGLGRGSEFEVRLPSGEAEDGVGAPSRTDGASADVPAAAGAARSRRILIVDDNIDGADSLAMLLQLSGHETEIAHDGVAGLAAAERWRPEMVLLDIGLPRLNGYEVCRRIRDAAWGQDMSVIALSGWGQVEDRRRSQEAGFDVHLVKPVDHDRLAKLLDSPPRRASASLPTT